MEVSSSPNSSARSLASGDAGGRLTFGLGFDFDLGLEDCVLLVTTFTFFVSGKVCSSSTTMLLLLFSASCSDAMTVERACCSGLTSSFTIGERTSIAAAMINNAGSSFGGFGIGAVDVSIFSTCFFSSNVSLTAVSIEVLAMSCCGSASGGEIAESPIAAIARAGSSKTVGSSASVSTLRSKLSIDVEAAAFAIAGSLSSKIRST
mmetsp:Transcript_13776/g.29158  ORF Transcript_13776/g.29158 Transcript_13776/m.29158 type:complete len:205 (-) Transcript_13776:1367-1981(-)